MSQYTSDVTQRIRAYLEKAHQALDTGTQNLRYNDPDAAINRAYYAIFYAANALLVTKGLERSKHSGVIAAFRQYFVKPGLIEPEYSDYYGRTMDERQLADYTLAAQDANRASTALDRARRFVTRVEQYLQNGEYLL